MSKITVNQSKQYYTQKQYIQKIIFFIHKLVNFLSVLSQRLFIFGLMQQTKLSTYQLMSVQYALCYISHDSMRQNSTDPRLHHSTQCILKNGILFTMQCKSVGYKYTTHRTEVTQSYVKPCSYQTWSNKQWKFADWPKLFFGNAAAYDGINQWQQTQCNVRLTVLRCLYLAFQPIMYNTEWLLERFVRLGLRQKHTPQLHRC